MPRPEWGASPGAAPSEAAASKIEILRDQAGREVVKFTTPSGVVGIVATCIPDSALRAFARALQRKIRRRERARRSASER
jgi:hypothetical protein